MNPIRPFAIVVPGFGRTTPRAAWNTKRDMTRILVVEDEPGIAMALGDDLRLEGYDVDLVGDGTTAVRKARGERFDLVLLDIMLPGKDGFDVCRELRRSGIATPSSCSRLARRNRRRCWRSIRR